MIDFIIINYYYFSIKYDPYTGIFGMDFYVVLGRKGKRVAYRRRRLSKLGMIFL